jgi:hypothetical protein
LVFVGWGLATGAGAAGTVWAAGVAGVGAGVATWDGGAAGSVASRRAFTLERGGDVESGPTSTVVLGLGLVLDTVVTFFWGWSWTPSSVGDVEEGLTV